MAKAAAGAGGGERETEKVGREAAEAVGADHVGATWGMGKRARGVEGEKGAEGETEGGAREGGEVEGVATLACGGDGSSIGLVLPVRHPLSKRRRGRRQRKKGGGGGGGGVLPVAPLRWAASLLPESSRPHTQTHTNTHSHTHTHVHSHTRTQ